MNNFIQRQIQKIRDAIHSIFHTCAHNFEEDPTFTNGFRWRYCTRPGCYRIEVTTHPIEHPDPLWLEREDGIRRMRALDNKEHSKKDLVKILKLT